jgi:serine phosphatase RsbU (regulator of sigma subunit)
MSSMKRVIIVEDDAVIAHLHQVIVRQLGHEVIASFDTGADAVAFLRTNEADLVLMDVRLDGELKDGIELMHEIRSFSQVPVVYISGHADKEVYHRASDTDMIGFLTKPIDSNQLDSLLVSVQDISESLRYAKKVQDCIFPERKEIAEVFPHHAVINKPKHIVGGDIVYFRYVPREHRVIAGVLDCTGHGVPAALLSVLAHETLNSCVDESEGLDGLLERFNNKLYRRLMKSGDFGSHQSVDVALAEIDLVNHTISISGAHRPVFYYDSATDTMEQYRFQTSAIGTNEKKAADFQVVTRGYAPKDNLYFFTDGITDQMGGANDKKLKRSSLFSFLHRITNNPMLQQEIEMNYFFYKWRGESEQTDDVTIFALNFQR